MDCLEHEGRAAKTRRSTIVQHKLEKLEFAVMRAYKRIEEKHSYKSEIEALKEQKTLNGPKL